MRVQIVVHHPPLRRSTARCEQVFEEADIVFLSARVADDALHLAGGDLERRDQSLCAMALVLIFPSLDLARLHRQARRSALQGLHTAHLVDRYSADALFRGFWGLQVDRTDVGAFRLEVARTLVQPVAHRRKPFANH